MRWTIESLVRTIIQLLVLVYCRLNELPVGFSFTPLVFMAILLWFGTGRGPVFVLGIRCLETNSNSCAH
jgi:hypothetical protein